MRFFPKFGKLEWALCGLILAGASIGLLLMTGDPVYAVKEHLPGSSYRTYDGLIQTMAEKHGVPPDLVKALVWQESRFDSKATGTAGERGLMQVTEAAATDWVNANRIETFDPVDLFDPKTNLDAGIWYLARALRRNSFREDPRPFALAEYNAGATRVSRWLEGEDANQPMSAPEFILRIDFLKTVYYIESILARQKFYSRRGDFSQSAKP